MSIDTMFLVITLVILPWLLLHLGKLSVKHRQLKQVYKKLEKEHGELQRRLQVRGRRLDVLLSTISEVVLRVDYQGRVLGGNKQAQALFEFDHIPGVPQAMLVFYRDSEWLIKYQQAVEALPTQCLLPEMVIQQRTFLPRLAALGDKEALLLCMDVTAHVQLEQKQKLLLENLMHDLKTPLTSLLGYARSIESFADDPALQQEAAAVIAREAKYINGLMNSLLTLNQISYQEHAANVGCDVVQVGHKVWQSLQQPMQDKGLELAYSMQEDGGREEKIWVTIPEADCHRVLMNVASNALRHAPVDSTIECVVKCVDEIVQITINDCGCGIADKHITRVTERFYRVDDVRNRGGKAEEGHGLGLAIVKEILERDGGALRLSNRDAGGLSVVLYVPKSFQK